MKANEDVDADQYLKIDAMTEEGVTVDNLQGSQISPRGVCATCSPDHIAQLHSKGHEEGVPKYRSLLLTLELGFSTGEVIQLETSAQIQSIRRISQDEFEVYLGFNNMIQDGYRHIARYIVDIGDRVTL